MNKKKKCFIIVGGILILLLIGITFNWYFHDIYAVKKCLKTTQAFSNDVLATDNSEYVAGQVSYETVALDNGLQFWYSLSVYEEIPAFVLVFDSVQQAEDFINGGYFSERCIFSKDFINENGVCVQYKYYLSDDAVPLVLNRKGCVQVDNIVIYGCQSDIQWWNPKVGATILEVVNEKTGDGSLC